ncbi:MAG: DUF4236 domain-containing protein [Roseovarius sp.]|nr:DUF4236 domain-containing protein [Roseovarius sp.]
MGFGFRKSIKIAPGVRLNVGKIKSSLSIGGKGLTTNVSKRGLKSTVSIPKTGLSYTTETASLSAKEKVSKKTTANKALPSHRFSKNQ